MGKKISQLDAIATGDVAEATDLVAVFDTTANKLKKISVEDFLALVPAGFDIASLPTITATDIVSSDSIPMYDASELANKRMTYNVLMQYISRNFQNYPNISAGGIDQVNDFVFVWNGNPNFGLAKLSVQDFLSLAGGGGGLTNWSESTDTNDFGSDTFNVLKASGAQINIDAVISPKGNGSFRLSDSANRNDNGVYSVDLQIVSNGSSNIAAAPYSGITNGFSNGVKSTANFARVGGRYCYATRYGEDAWSGVSTNNSLGGDGMSKMVLVETVDGQTATELSADTSTTQRVRFDLTTQTARVVVDLVAVCTSVGNGTCVLGEVFSTSKAALIHKVSGTSTIIGTTTYGTAISESSMADCDLTFGIDAGSQDLRVLFTPPSTAGTTSQFRVTAAVHITDMFGN